MSKLFGKKNIAARRHLSTSHQEYSVEIIEYEEAIVPSASKLRYPLPEVIAELQRNPDNEGGCHV
jgi:hypothetical protein